MREYTIQLKESCSRRMVLKGLTGLVMSLSVEGCMSAPSSTSTSKAPAHHLVPGNVLSTYHGHTKRVTAVAWSPDGKRIASGSLDKTVQVWGAVAEEHLQTIIYHGHTDEVHAVTWSPDSKRIASGSADKTVQVWNAATGDRASTYHGHTDTVTSVAWSPDGAYIASSSVDGTVRVWDVSSGKISNAYHEHSDSVNAIGWSPDGKRLASGSSDKTVQIWDALTGNHAYTYRGHTNTVSCLSWSPDGSRIASGSWDKTVQVWNAATGSRYYTYNGYNVQAAKYNTGKGVLPDLIFFVAWSHNGKRIAAVTQVYCGDNCAVMVIWDAETERNFTFYQDLPVFAMAWSPDDTRIVTSIGYSDVQISQAI